MAMKSFAWCLLGLLLSPTIARAQSLSYFPRVLTAQPPTGLALSNPTATAANVTLTFFNSAGDPIVADPIALPSGGQIARLSTELFSSAGGARGWVQVSSDVAGLSGFYLNGDFIRNADGGDFVQPSTALTFLRVVESSTSSTELNISNPNATVTTVTLTLLDADGATLDVDPVNVPANGQVQGTIESLMGVTADVNGYITAAGTQAVMGSAVILTGDDDFTSLNAVTGLGADTLFFPQVALGDGWATTFLIQNTGSSSVPVDLGFWADDGTQGPTETVTINPGQLFSADAADLFQFPDTPLRVGWVRARAASSVLEGAQEFRYGPALGVTTLPASKTASLRLIQSHIAEQTSAVLNQTDLFTGLAVLNPSNSAATATIQVVKTDGSLVAEQQTQLGAMQKSSLLLREIMPEARGETSGAVWVRSDVPLHALQLFGTWNLAMLSQIPAQSLDAIGALATPTMNRFVISGTVAGPEGMALGGISVNGTGTSNVSALTDYSGAFVIKDVAADTYNVLPSKTGFSFGVTQAITVGPNTRNLSFTAVQDTGGGDPPDPPPAGLSVSPAVVEVRVNSTTAVGAYQATVTFDPAVVSLSTANVSGGNAPFQETPITVNINNTSGEVILNAFQIGSSPVGTVVVARLEFTARSAGSSALTVKDTLVTDLVGDDVDAATVDLSVPTVAVTSQ